MRISSHHVVLALSLVIVAAGLYAASRSPTVQQTALAPAAVSSDPWVGKTAPAFALQTLDGKTLRLADFRGRVVLLNFWATWCAPCRVEMPYLVSLHRQYGGSKFEIVGIAMDDGDRDKVQQFVHEMNVAYPIVLKDAAVGGAYGGVRFLPQSFLLDREGKIVAHIIGMRSRADFEALIKKATS